MKIQGQNQPKVKPPSLAPDQAVKTFSEVELGYTRQEAIDEARRSLKYDMEKSKELCPFKVDLSGMLTFIAAGDFDSALQAVFNSHAWPGILGRHCFRYCEQAFQKVVPHEEVPALATLERAVATFGDWTQLSPPNGEPTGKSVAIIGAGSAGAAACYRLRQHGHQVTLFDQLPITGGMMAIGFPEFRLPSQVLRRECDFDAWGVKTVMEYHLDREALDGLLAKYDQVLITTGKFKGRTMDTPGVALKNVYTALEFLIRFRTHQQVTLGNHVVIVGAGYTAQDVSRTCRRLGSNDVKILYRRSAEDMPVKPHLRHFFVHRQQAEGCPYIFNTLVCEILGNENGAVSGLRIANTLDGETPIPGTERNIPADCLIQAVGEQPDLSFLPDSVVRDGYLHIKVNDHGQTSLANLFAAGEVAGVNGTVNAFASGLRTAELMSRLL